MNTNSHDHLNAEVRRHLLQRFLQVRSAVSPSVSPDGKALAFRTNLTGTHQVWTTDLNGAWPEQVTFGAERAQYAWHSPDGQYIAYGTDHGGNERSQIHLLNTDGTGDRDLSNNPSAFHTFGAFSPDSTQIVYASNCRNPAFFDAYIMPVEGGESRLLHKGDSYFLPQAFSPDGKRVLLFELFGSFANKLHELTLKTGEVRTLTEGMWRYRSISYAPDGRSLLLITDQDRDFLGVARLDLEDLSVSYLLEAGWDVESMALCNAGKRGALIVNEDAVSCLHVFDLSPGIEAALKDLPAKVKLPNGHMDGLSFSKDGQILAFAQASPKNNSNIFVIEGEAAPRQVTFSSASGFDRDSFIEPTRVTYPSFDGREIPGVLYVPKHTEDQVGQLPVIVYVHGGPESQSRVSYSSLFQYFLDQGFGVFTPNVRGSTGYGRAYSELDNTVKRLDSVKDLVAAALWLKTQGIFHPDRIAVMGGSYGGYMVLAALSMFPEHWAAGVDVVGIANLRTFIANTGSYRRRWRMLEYGDPAEIGEIMDELSPINHVHKIRAPLMVIHGANDPRVPQSEADQIVEAVKARGGVVEYLLYPDEGHGLSKLKNRLHCYAKVGDFLHHHVAEDE